MQVTVQYFARLHELAQAREWTCEVPDGATVADVWTSCTASHPAIAVFDGRVSTAVNAEFSSMDAPVHDGDEVAFLPPVSGGNGTEP